MAYNYLKKIAYFYPRPPRGGRLAGSRTLTTTMGISIHALREEGDPVSSGTGQTLNNFYPRPPRGGRHSKAVKEAMETWISIHALREEGDSKNRDKISIFL